MRQRVFRETSKDGKREYWSFTTSAFRDKNCKLKWFVKFVNCIEPFAQKGYTNNREYKYADVDIQECSFENTTEFNGVVNPSITIFAYTEVKPKQNDLASKVEEFKQDNQINIEQDNLPFY